MNDNIIREPMQKRSIEKKEKIIKSGFDLICNKGYHNTNTAEIAKEANVSTGIVYQYFKDKHDIFIAGLEKYSNDIFFPMIEIKDKDFENKDLKEIVKNMIKQYIKNHKLSESAHEEIMAMAHSDKDVAFFYHKRELDLTYSIYETFKNHNINKENLLEKIHIAIGLIDNLSHEIVYHKHKEINYDIMTDIVIDEILNLLK